MAAPVVLLEDAHLLAVSKPAGLPVQGDPTGDADLLTLLRRERKEPALELAHRIDRPVSGVVLLARTPEANAAVHALFRERRMEKRYWAIVEGRIDASSVLLEHHLMHDERNRRTRIANQGDGEPARTHVKLLAQGDRYALVECMPEGGAFHQIRAQLAAWGHPIMGDVKYGARRALKDRSIGLHARSLRFEHPFTGAEVRVEATAPEAMPWPALVALAGAAPADRRS
ncbi:MAG: RluA family pseudouridine synthase [Flavobacteriales bacterium]|nr:MAG: RluA family pseudouridine synthase [Flavobacteriales bacterium]